MTLIHRRGFLKTGALAAGALLTSRVTLASASSDSRFVLVILRGAMDGLSAVPPYGDPDYANLRRDLALPAPGSTNGVHALDSLFGLHPSLAFLQESFAARELVVLHAIASPYRERSHFDGQDVLENGHTRPHADASGWLNRALAALPSDPGRGELGVALGHNVPLVMRGPAAVSSWSPSRLAALDEDTLERIADLYASDPLLSQRLADALETDAIAEAAQEDALAVADEAVGGDSLADTAMADAAGAATDASLRSQRGRFRALGRARYVEVVRAAAGFLRRPDGARVAVFDTTGWDTHANEGAGQGQLALRLAALDQGLRTLRRDMGDLWKNTAVLVVTEFGRTAAINGTRGTDHGTASAAFLLGGAVAGGRVVADWPGLSARALHEGRDVRPTADLRAVMKGVLADHMGVPARALESSVFPDSVEVKAATGLIQG